MKLSRGDVVLLDFPFSDASGGKVRPAVVVQSDRHNRRMTSTIVVLVTKTLRRARRESRNLKSARPKIIVECAAQTCYIAPTLDSSVRCLKTR